MAIHPFPMLGDIVLMNARKDVIGAQSLIRRRKASYSHAAIAIDSEGYVDSIAGRGVGVAYWADEDPAMAIRAFRHRSSVDHSGQRLAAMLEHYGKAYNFAFAAKGHPFLSKRFHDTFYCSEYVGQVYSRAELGVDARKRLLMPADLEQLSFSPDWDDVTEHYRDYLGVARPELRGTGNAHLFAALGQNGVLLRRNTKECARVNAQADELIATLRGYTAVYTSLANARRGRR